MQEKLENTLFCISSLKFQRFFSITRIFFPTVDQNNFGDKIPFLVDKKFLTLHLKKVSFDWVCLLFGP